MGNSCKKANKVNVASPIVPEPLQGDKVELKKQVSLLESPVRNTNWGPAPKDAGAPVQLVKKEVNININIKGGSNPDTINWNEVIEEIMGSSRADPSTDKVLKEVTPQKSGEDEDDEFDLEATTTIQPFESPGSGSVDKVNLTIICDISRADKSEVRLPLPLATTYQKKLNIHSFDPQPAGYEVVSEQGWCYLKCQYAATTSRVKYSLDIEINEKKYKKNQDFSLPIGTSGKTCVDFINWRHPRLQDIVKRQRWNSIPSQQERARAIAEYVGTIPYHIPNMYDQIHHYLDYKHKRRDGFAKLFTLFCKACSISDPVQSDSFDNVIFENTRDLLFFKICYPETVQIDVLNKSRDNELMKYYM